VGTGQNNLQLVIENVALVDTTKLPMLAFRALNVKVLLNFLSSGLFSIRNLSSKNSYRRRLIWLHQ